MEGRPYIGASPDALVDCQCCEKRVLEVKCPERMAKFLGDNTEKSVGNVSSMKLKRTTPFFCQVQMQMGLTGCSNADLFVYITDEENECISVKFDKNYFNNVVERASFFLDLPAPTYALHKMKAGPPSMKYAYQPNIACFSLVVSLSSGGRTVRLLHCPRGQVRHINAEAEFKLTPLSITFFLRDPFLFFVLL